MEKNNDTIVQDNDESYEDTELELIQRITDNISTYYSNLKHRSIHIDHIYNLCYNEFFYENYTLNQFLQTQSEVDQAVQDNVSRLNGIVEVLDHGEWKECSRQLIMNDAQELVVINSKVLFPEFTYFMKKLRKAEFGEINRFSKIEYPNYPTEKKMCQATIESSSDKEQMLQRVINNRYRRSAALTRVPTKVSFRTYSPTKSSVDLIKKFDLYSYKVFPIRRSSTSQLGKYFRGGQGGNKIQPHQRSFSSDKKVLQERVDEETSSLDRGPKPVVYDWFNFLKELKSLTLKQKLPEDEVLGFLIALLYHNKLEVLKMNLERSNKPYILNYIQHLDYLRVLKFQDMCMYDVTLIPFYQNLHKMKNLQVLEIDFQQFNCGGEDIVFIEFATAIRVNTSIIELILHIENISYQVQNLELIPRAINSNEYIKKLDLRMNNCTHNQFFIELGQLKPIETFSYMSTLRNNTENEELDMLLQCEALTHLKCKIHQLTEKSHKYSKFITSISSNRTLQELDLDYYINSHESDFLSELVTQNHNLHTLSLVGHPKLNSILGSSGTQLKNFSLIWSQSNYNSEIKEVPFFKGLRQLKLSVDQFGIDDAIKLCLHVVELDGTLEEFDYSIKMKYKNYITNINDDFQQMVQKLEDNHSLKKFHLEYSNAEGMLVQIPYVDVEETYVDPLMKMLQINNKLIDFRLVMFELSIHPHDFESDSESDDDVISPKNAISTFSHSPAKRNPYNKLQVRSPARPIPKSPGRPRGSQKRSTYINNSTSKQLQHIKQNRRQTQLDNLLLPTRSTPVISRNKVPKLNLKSQYMSERLPSISSTSNLEDDREKVLLTIKSKLIEAFFFNHSIKKYYDSLCKPIFSSERLINSELNEEVKQIKGYYRDKFLNFRKKSVPIISQFSAFVAKIWPVKVDLTKCGLTDTNTDLIMKFITDNACLEYITLDDNQLGDGFFTPFFTEIETSKSVCLISMDHIKFSKASLRKMRQAILNNVSLKRIKISLEMNKEQKQYIKRLHELITVNKHLAKLVKNLNRFTNADEFEDYLNDENYFVEGRKYEFASVLKYFTIVEKRTLEITNSHFNKHHCSILGEYLDNEKCSLNNINLRRNKIDDEGLNYLSCGLKNNTSVTYLELNRNVFTDVGVAQYLLKNLQYNYTLKRLNIDFGNTVNNYTKQQVEAQVQANDQLMSIEKIENWDRVSPLDLDLSDKGPTYLLTSMKACNLFYIRSLNLCDNYLGDDHARQITKALLTNTRLEYLYLKQNQFTQKCSGELSKLFDHKLSKLKLRHIDLSHNVLGDVGIANIGYVLMHYEIQSTWHLNNNEGSKEAWKIIRTVIFVNKNIDLHYDTDESRPKIVPMIEISPLASIKYIHRQISMPDPNPFQPKSKPMKDRDDSRGAWASHDRSCLSAQDNIIRKASDQGRSLNLENSEHDDVQVKVSKCRCDQIEPCKERVNNIVKQIVKAKRDATIFQCHQCMGQDFFVKTQKMITILLYTHIIAFVLFAIVMPIIMIRMTTRTLYAYLMFLLYIILSILLELGSILFVIYKIGDKSVYKFNSWHLIKIMAGQVARTDVFTDVVFVTFLQVSKMDTVVFYPSAVVLGMSLMYPVYMYFKLIKTSKSSFFPLIERNTKLSYICDFQALATTLDAFCLQIFHDIGRRRKITIPRTQALLKTTLEDFPQFVLQMVFLFYDERSQVRDIIVPTLLSMTSLLCSVFTALTATTSDINIDEAKESIEQRHREMKKFTDENMVQMNKTKNLRLVKDGIHVSKRPHSRTLAGKEVDSPLTSLKSPQLTMSRTEPRQGMFTLNRLGRGTIDSTSSDEEEEKSVELTQTMQTTARGLTSEFQKGTFLNEFDSLDNQFDNKQLKHKQELTPSAFYQSKGKRKDSILEVDDDDEDDQFSHHMGTFMQRKQPGLEIKVQNLMDDDDNGMEPPQATQEINTFHDATNRLIN